MTVVKQTEGITSLSICHHRTSPNHHRSLVQAGSLEPCLDSEILQLQIGRIAYHHTIAAAIKTECLSDKPWHECCVPTQSTVVRIEFICRVAIPFPPTDQT